MNYNLENLSLNSGQYKINSLAAGNEEISSALGNTVNFLVEKPSFTVMLTESTLYDDLGENCVVNIYDGQDNTGKLLVSGVLTSDSDDWPYDNVPLEVTSGYLCIECISDSYWAWTYDAYGDRDFDTGTLSEDIYLHSETPSQVGNRYYNTVIYRVLASGTIQGFECYYYCLAAGTQVALANGTTKAVENITYEDDILVWDFYEGKLNSAKPKFIMVEKTAPRYNLLKFSNGAELKLVGPGKDIGYHRIYNDESKSFTHTGVAETPIGTTTYSLDGSYPTLVAQEVVNESVKYYNIITDKHYNLFANGILTSCRLSNKYAIENMKYVGEQLITDDYEADYFKRLEKDAVAKEIK